MELETHFIPKKALGFIWGIDFRFETSFARDKFWKWKSI